MATGSPLASAVDLSAFESSSPSRLAFAVPKELVLAARILAAAPSSCSSRTGCGAGEDRAHSLVGVSGTREPAPAALFTAAERSSCPWTRLHSMDSYESSSLDPTYFQCSASNPGEHSVASITSKNIVDI